MGWSSLEVLKPSILLEGTKVSDSYYFVHSYKAPTNESLCAVNASVEQIPAVVEFKNFYGTQFHPEKSADAGAQILKNFVSLRGPQ